MVEPNELHSVLTLVDTVGEKFGERYGFVESSATRDVMIGSMISAAKLDSMGKQLSEAGVTWNLICGASPFKMREDPTSQLPIAELSTKPYLSPNFSPTVSTSVRTPTNL